MTSFMYLYVASFPAPLVQHTWSHPPAHQSLHTNRLLYDPFPPIDVANADHSHMSKVVQAYEAMVSSQRGKR